MHRPETAGADAPAGVSPALHHLLDRTPDLVVSWGPGGTVQHLNAAARALAQSLGVEAPLRLEHLVARASRRALAAALDEVMARGLWSGELLLAARAGALPVSVVMTWGDDSGALLARDISGYADSAADLAHRATHDKLTGLANRDHFVERLRAALARGGGRRSGGVAVLFADIDRFKAVNDTLGHDTGDELLVQVANRLVDVVRPEDLVARLGGDEFVVLCRGVPDEASALTIAERVRESVERPFALAGKGDLVVTVSVGVAVGADLAPDLLLRQADVAMYQAKERGRARCALFDEALRARTAGRVAMESALRRALAHREFRVLYQPQYSLASGSLVGAEALVRWQHPERGLVGPMDFIPVAEESGLIVPIGSWVLEEACRQAQAWADAYPGAEAMDVHVNLSPRQFTQPDLPRVVADVLARTGLPAGRLCLEITETAVMDAIEHAATTLQVLRETGIKVAVDDFGTGHSSLSYLRRLPVDVLKLDRSFITRLGDDPTDSAIVVAVINLARSLGLTVVAEGVESEKQRRELRALGCSLAQGFYFARPMPAEDLERLVADEPWR